MKQLRRVPMTDNFLSLPIPTGMYKNIYAHFTGTNQSGQMLLATQLGTVRMIVNNKQYVFINNDRLIFYDELKNGSVAQVSTTGAEFNFWVKIPMAIPGDERNVLLVESDGEVTLEFNGFYVAGVAVILTGSLIIYGELQEGIQAYFLKIDQPDYNAVAGIGNEDLKGIENIYELLLENDTANLNQVTIYADNKTCFNGDREAFVNMTNEFNQIETYNPTIAFLDFELARSKQLSEALSDSVSIQTNMGTAAALNVIVFSIDFAPAKEVSSAALLQNQIELNLQRKGSQGKTRPAKVLSY